MSEVHLDGEPVNFEGPPPKTVNEVWSLVENFLGQTGKIVDRFLVDGEVWYPESGEKSDCYAKIEVFSLSQEEHIFNLVTGLLGQRTQLLERWRMGAQTSLRTPWADFQSQAVDILNETQPIAQCVALLSEYSRENDIAWATSLSDAGKRLNEGLSTVIDAFDKGNCVVYSDVAESDVQSGLEEVYRVFSEEIVKNLETGGNP